ncbi:uncharacterized protein PV09_03450 [Verruconis gallopava]|uniref:PHD-type domain-containing protein n=1 Tax=Verruconis gallopava TaxID=253628 RepID=A0A0D2AGB6_9PEZI|nr:uncharacterized protein PV09_03450 [Verruconis gallopava]KIW05575.1 hypothetical protein PV09_03450 [Verruconis gallopava]
MPNLRGTRQRPSRTSSPFVRTANTSPAPPSESKREQTQSRLDAWVEPPLRSPVPSFQDHGMERTAIFQDMAPLGTMPPTRLKIKMKGDSKPDKSDSLPASDVATATPEGTPPIETKTSETASQEEAQTKQKQVKREIPPVKEDNLADKVVSNGPLTTPHVRSPAVQNGTPTPAHSRKTSTNTIALPSPQRPIPIASRASRDQKLEKVVRKAIEMAKASGQDKLAAVITMFYEETFSNPSLAVLFDAVITKSETEAQKKQFAIEMKRIRKAVKKESRESSRARTMSSSGPPSTAGYSGQTPIIGTMASPTSGQQPTMGYYPSSQISQRTPFSPQQTQQPPFSTFRSVLQPSPFSPTQSHPGSPTHPSNAPMPSERPGIASSQQTLEHSAAVLTPQQTRQSSQSQAQVQAKSTPQPSTTTVVSTRRSTRAAGADATATLLPVTGASIVHPTTPTPAEAPPTSQAIEVENEETTTGSDRDLMTNGTKKTDTSEGSLTSNIRTATKETTKSPRSAKGRRRRSPSVESGSSLSSVDEAVVEKGNPTAVSALPAAQAESLQPSRAVSRSATPRPGPGPKAKTKKGSHLKNLAGTKRGASETLALEEVDEETRLRREKVKANLDRDLRDRKAEEPNEQEFSSFRDSEEYASSLPDGPGLRSRRTTRRQSAPDTSRVISTRNSTAAATPEVTGGRRARQSTQNQRLSAIDVVSTAPRLEVHTPSTPDHPASDAESNGDPPPKRRRTARTKYSPVKLPNGVAPKTFEPASRSSPLPDGGREGKKPNRDQCFSCGCGGDLICCDMCQNSFHAECWDPPCKDANDEQFQGFEWICTHCRIWEKRKDNEERARRGEPLELDSSDEGSVATKGSDVPETPPDWNLLDRVPIKVPLFEQLTKGFKELLPEQFGLKPVIRDAYDGYVVDSERRYRPIQKAPINVDSRLRPTEAIFDDGKHIKDPKDMKQCVYCGLSAVSKKGDLIKCDTCGDFWHLDCLPSPTTAPPQTWSAVEKRGNRMTDVYKKRYWECPRHVEQDMILLSDPTTYSGDLNNVRGIKVRLPRRQVAQVAAIREQAKASRSQTVREAPDDVMLVNIEVDDSWWEKYDARRNEMKETENNSYTIHENNVLADFAAKARNNRLVLSQSNDELIDALVPNTYQRDQLKKLWHDRQQSEIEIKVQKEVEATMTLAGLRQQAQGINVNDLLAPTSDEEAVSRLVGFMTHEQIKQMQLMLDAVSKRIREHPELASAERCAELDGDMDAILAGGTARHIDSVTAATSTVPVDSNDGDEEPSAKRRKTHGELADKAMGEDNRHVYR